jgi:tRNA-2-methylthio-N6-dimethylallyladenosine synthase
VVDSGYLEIEILGQNVNAYRSEGWDFTRLLGAVARVRGLRRLRFTTSHPLHFKNSIADLMGASPVLCPHVHLPFQSGSNRVLKAMRRGYTRQEFLARVAYARSRVPGLALSTDVIVGFPGETEEEFQETLEVIREVRFHQIYAFLYSPRRGTEAAGIQDSVPREEKGERLRRLMEIQQAIQDGIHAGYRGRILEVLVEGPSARNPELLSGRTPCHRVVIFPGPVEWTGRMVEVAIEGAGVNTLRGKALSAGMPRPPLTSPRGGDITDFGRTISGEAPS